MKVLWLSLAIVVVAPAWAGELCDKAETTIEIDQCAQAEHQEADRKLNVAYQAALKHIESTLSDTRQGKDTRKGLVEAQRLWVRFRDKDCKAIYSLWSDGTIRGGMYWNCMIAHTEQRIRELDSFTDQQ